MLDIFRALILALWFSAAYPYMGCDRLPAQATVCWVVDSGRTTYLTPINIQHHWPKLAQRWGIK